MSEKVNVVQVDLCSDSICCLALQLIFERVLGVGTSFPIFRTSQLFFWQFRVQTVATAMKATGVVQTAHLLARTHAHIFHVHA